MKKLLAMTLLTLSTLTMAAETVVIHSKIYRKNDEWQLDRTRFRVNPSMGRAWVFAEMSDIPNSNFDTSYDDKSIAVTGMSFNQATGDIIYNGVVCATTKSSGRKIKIYPTGKCRIGSFEEKVQIDNGFNMIRKNRLNITLTTY